MYSVTIKPSAMKSLEKINEPYYSKLKKAIYALANNPHPAKSKKMVARSGYRLRVANYRIIYEVFDNYLTIDVIEIGHRKDIYK
jgi:mRNA interferase RelE/StbE